MNPVPVSRKVLVADDEQDICLYLKRYLERKKMKVAVVFDGQDAKKLIENDNFDYVLLDCSMPNVTGLELIEKARQRNPGARIVLISGFPAVDSQIVQKLGGDLFIHKPIQLEEIDAIFNLPAV
ncbi:MAG: response regulator [Candidatus Omnitrophota bacterium]|jgi:DNA-binding response OmpR family regulator|nr:response regulator [Candidatus Omnitrophota bacterium]MDD5137443.1 response regulator [Candidatus Omnitrophota bacterium]MDD5538595.1 response regulator [Candidatus Omnitrophota bacterium]